MKTSSGVWRMTAEDLYDIPNHVPPLGDRSYELEYGALRVREPGGFYHSAVGIRIAMRLARYAEEQELGVVLGADTGFIVQRDPDSVLAPQVSFVGTPRVPDDETMRRQFFEGAPDLAVEIVSADDRRVDVDRKARRWLGAGAYLVWILDARTRSVTVYRPDVVPYTLDVTETLHGGEVVPGFRVPVAELFP